MSVNLFGCVAFAAAAVAGYIQPSTGDMVDVAWVNGATVLGALAFLIGAALLLAEGAGEPVTGR